MLLIKAKKGWLNTAFYLGHPPKVECLFQVYLIANIIMIKFKRIAISLLMLLIALPAFTATEWVNGEIVRIDLARRKAVIKHEYIPSIQMEAMTMPFKVNNQVNLEKFQVGEKVRFQVQQVDGDLDVKAMEKK